MTTTALSSGIYRIEVVGGVEVGCLTYESGDVVTILPPSAQLSSEQEVMRRFLTTSIVCHSPAILVANHLR